MAMNDAIRGAQEAREASAERELTGRSECRVRTVAEATAVQAALERALTMEVRPHQLRTVPVDQRMIVALIQKLTVRRPRGGRDYSVVWTAAANGGLSLRPRNGWEGSQESGKGGREP
jgi:hypothetical protein